MAEFTSKSDQQRADALEALPHTIPLHCLALCAEDLQEQLIKWLKYIAYERRMSAHTLRAYCQDLTHFITFLHGYNEAPPSLATLADSKVRDFRAWLSHKAVKNKQSNASRARSLSGLKNFLRWLDKNGIAHNAAIGLMQSPKLPHKLPRPLEEKQTDRLMEKADSLAKEEWVGARNQALMLLLYGCGLRIQEALSLNIKDLPAQPYQSLRIFGKGAKERLVPVLPIVHRALTHAISQTPFAQEPNAPIFRGKRGGRLHQSSAQRDMRTIRGELMLPETATPHALRHSFATHLLQNGANLREIQELLGHASLSSTQRYTELNTKELLDIYKTAHPRQ